MTVSTQVVSRDTAMLQGYKSVCMLCSLVFVSLTAFTQNLAGGGGTETLAEGLSILDAYQLAKVGDPTLEIARLRVDGALAEKDVSRGKLLPQVSIFGEWSENEVRYENSGSNFIPTQEYPGERYGVQLRSTLFNMRTYREYERQTALVEQSESQLAATESELLTLVTQSYLNVLLTQESLDQVETELSALEYQLEEAKALYQKSLLPITEVLETQTRTETMRSEVVNTRGQVAIARDKLKQLLGLGGFTLRAIVDSHLLSHEVPDVDEAVRLAMERDPATRAAEQAVNAARKGVEREKGSWFPEVDFVYVSQYSDVGFDNLTSPPRTSESFSVSMRYALFEGGAGSARLRAARTEFYTAKQQLEAAKRRATGRARAAWMNLQTATEGLQASRQAVKTADVNLDAARKAFKVGAARPTDVLLALSQSTQAKRYFSEARYRRVMGWLELNLATGGDPAASVTVLSSTLHGY